MNKTMDALANTVKCLLENQRDRIRGRFMIRSTKTLSKVIRVRTTGRKVFFYSMQKSAKSLRFVANVTKF